MRGGVSATRIRLFRLASNRGIGEEVYVIYDAKNVGSEVMANDAGSAYWTLPINHGANPDCVPLQRHYKIERLNIDTDTYDLVGAGLLMSADVTNDEIVYTGADYMSIMEMHYTPVLGADSSSTSPLSYPAGSTKPVIENKNATLVATRTASALKTTTGGTNNGTVTSDWNSNDTEIHLPVGHSGLATTTGGSTYYKYRSAIKFDLAGWSDFTSADVIQKAELRLYQVGAGLTPAGHIVRGLGPARILYLSKASSDFWSDTTSGGENSWANATPDSTNMWVSGVVPDAQKSFTGGTSVDGTQITIDITALVKSWKSGTTNNGIVLSTGKGTASSSTTSNANYVGTENTLNAGLEFYSSAYSKTQYRPQLYIEYQKNTTSSGANYDLQGMFAATQDAKAFLQKARCQSASGDVVANSASNNSGLGTTGLPRLPQSVYITRSSRADIVAMADDNTRGLEINRIDCTFDEINQKYIIKGYVQYERVNRTGTTFTTFYDYINNNRSISVEDSTTRPKCVDVVFETSPGGAAFCVRAWSPDYSPATGADDSYSLEFPFYVEVYKSASVTSDINKPFSSTPSISSNTVWTSAKAGISSYAMPSSPMYKVPILAVDGQSYEFSATAVVTLNNATPSTEIMSASAAVADQSSSPLALRNETLQDTFTRFLTATDGVFNQASIDGVTVGRLNWMSIENVDESLSGVWPTNKIRYYTSGEAMTSFLRAMCEKQMNANETSVLDGVELPDRTVFNFVGVRRANGTAADGTKLFVHPALGVGDAGEDELKEYNYPGEIGKFRYQHSGDSVRNKVQVIASTAFITGTPVNMTGVRLQGAKTDNVASMKLYGIAPLLEARSGFVDLAEAQLAAKRSLDQRSTIESASSLTVEFENDTINPFSDVFLGDAVKINIRRTGISQYETTENAYPDLISTVYIISGVTYKYNPDGSENIQLHLLSSKYFSAGRMRRPAV